MNVDSAVMQMAPAKAAASEFNPTSIEPRQRNSNLPRDCKAAENEWILPRGTKNASINE
jgi:hypothetical protein